jgi:hypothetical protein
MIPIISGICTNTISRASQDIEDAGNQKKDIKTDATNININHKR